MATEREFTLPSGQSQTFEEDTSEGAVLEVRVDPGATRGSSSTDPPIRSYDLDIRDEGGVSVGSSPVSSSSLSERVYVTSDIGGLMQIELTNTGASRGTVVVTISVLSGDKAIKSYLTGISVDLGESRGLRLSDETFLTDRVLIEDGRVFDSPLDAVNAASSFALVGPGTFPETEEIVIDVNDFLLKGFGELSFIESTGLPADGIAVVVDGADRVTIDGIKVSTPVNAGDNLDSIGSRNEASEGIIKRCIVRESDERAIFVGKDAVSTGLTGEKWTVRDNLLSGAIGEAAIEDDYVDGIISGNIIDGGGDTDPNNGRGIEVSGISPQNTIVIGNTITGCADDGIQSRTAGTKIVYNSIIQPGEEGIQLQGPECMVVGNIIRSPNFGVSSVGSSAESLIANNTIIGASSSGIYSGNPSNNMIGNFIKASTDNGIWADAADNAVVGNVIIDSGTLAGVNVSDQDVTVAGNVVATASDIGIVCSLAGDKTAIIGNIIRDTVNDGINLGSSDTIVAGNILRQIGDGEADDSGIEADSHRTNIGRNTIIGPPTGIQLNADDQLASDNMIVNATTAIDTTAATTPTTTDNVIV